jgi:hypothetical protein
VSRVRGGGKDAPAKSCEPLILSHVVDTAAPTRRTPQSTHTYTYEEQQAHSSVGMSSASGSSSRKARGRDDGSPPASKDSRADALEGEEPKAKLWRMPKKVKLPTCHQGVFPASSRGVLSALADLARCVVPDHQPKDPKLVAMLRCTHVKQVYNSTKMKQCVNWYCGGCLDRRYGVDAEQIVQSDALKTWKCPVCIGSCEYQVRRVLRYLN